MKLFTKLFSGIMLILAVSLGFAEYYTVYRTFDTTLEHEKDNALRKHQLVKYALQADMVSAENLEMLDETTLQELVDQFNSSTILLTLELHTTSSLSSTRTTSIFL